MTATALVTSTVPNLPVVAGFYSQLAGVLAGFAFAGIIALVAAQLGTNLSGSKTLESGSALVGAFISLVIASLNYAVVAGEQAGTARVAALQTLAGLGFSVAGLMLLYSLLMLVRGIEHDAPSSRQSSIAMGDLMRVLLVVAISPIVILLMWSGAHDHLMQKYGPKVDHLYGLDWAVLGALVAYASAAMLFYIRFFHRAQYHPRLASAITYISTLLSILSLMGSTLLITFSDASSPVSDVVPLFAVILVALFALLIAYSASRFTIAKDAATFMSVQTTGDGGHQELVTTPGTHTS